MAKKTPVKKSRRRLKRSVRRSLAAVLMITAIGVAAIPVPENYAEEIGGEGGAATPTPSDVHTTEMAGDADADGGGKIPAFKFDPELKESDDTTYVNDEPLGTSDNFDIGIYADTDITDLAKIYYEEEAPIKGAKLDISLAVLDLGTEQSPDYRLSWQFMYYWQNPGMGDEGVICRYNTGYFARDVKLELNPTTKYFVVTTNEIDTYLSTKYWPVSESGTPGTPGWGDLDSELVMDPSPNATVQIEYTYKDYCDGKPADEFLTNYYGEELDQWVESVFKPYREGNGGEYKEGDNEKVEAFSRAPSDLKDVDAKARYFSEHCRTLRDAYVTGESFELVRVQDERPGKDGPAFLARGGAPAGEGFAGDCGFLALEKTRRPMTAIGDKAFRNVENVYNMEIPNQIAYIGNEAFMGARMLQSIKLMNVSSIGNRAFKGCNELATVDLGTTTKTIGQECFGGCVVLSSITFNSTVKTIGYGAFNNCIGLTSVSFADNIVDCEVKDYAFYNCSALTSVSMENAGIIKLGAGAFAIGDIGAQSISFVLPKSMSDAKSIGNYLFAGRASLQYVVFPQAYGHSAEANIPNCVFHGCENLQYVEFPCDAQNDPRACGFVMYDPKRLFADVLNHDFYVKGPKTNSAGQDAYPRTCTWDAITAVSNTVPYLYIEGGVEYYEVSDGYYLLCINDDGLLTSCTFKSKEPSDWDKWVEPEKFEEKADGTIENVGGAGGKLVIPALVGETKVTGIAGDCFKDSNLNKRVKELEIEDNSEIVSIAAGAFQGGSGTGTDREDWHNLAKVYIGNSITSIGDNAFKDCDKLVDVTFSSPLGGHEGFTIGTDAFKTQSLQLTFHGDIGENYAPFKWAMDPGNIIQEKDGLRVCYKSLAPTYLTVMYNPITKMVTLLDYPKYSEVESILAETFAEEIAAAGCETYTEWREKTLYNEPFGSATYDGSRERFAKAWWEALNAENVANAKKDVYANRELYGPWVNPDFCKGTNPNGWTKYILSGDTSSGDGSSSSSGSTDASLGERISDFLFEPIIAYAAVDDPDPYYKTNPYNVTYAANSKDNFFTPTQEESDLVFYTTNIEVPAGVQSIDVVGYVKDLTADGEEYTESSDSNIANYNTYLYNSWDSLSRDMYETEHSADEDGIKSVPGLFSGYYVDGTSALQETRERGNDVIRSVTMSTVEYLPDYAFDSCESLNYVILGKDCKDIGKAPFRGCHSMTTVGDNDYYTTANGIIYSVNTDGSYTIEECLAARGNLVGDAAVNSTFDPNLINVSAIKPGAFEDCDYLTEVNFGSKDTAGLAIIPEDCFKNCDDLQTVVLPLTTNEIKEGAFVGANDLSSLTIYGKEVQISGKAFDGSQNKKWTTVRAYADSAVVRYVGQYSTEHKLRYDEQHPLGEIWQVSFYDQNYVLIEDLKDQKGNDLENPQYVDDGGLAILPQNPASTDDWTFERWVGANNVELGEAIYEDSFFYARGYSTSGLVNGKYPVTFWDGLDGQQVGPTQYVAPGESAIAPAHPTHAGYDPDGFSGSYENVQAPTTVIMKFKATSGSGGSGSGGGGSASGSGNSNTSNRTSTSTTSTSSGSAGKYSVTVVNGSGSGTYEVGSTVIIAANTAPTGMVFQKWTTESNGVSFASVSMAATTFVMPGNNVTVTANYVAGTGGTSNAGSGSTRNPGTTANNNTANNGGTRVDITKPGISNKDLATANVNGSTDNFVVKISETTEATRAVADALSIKYGNLENILYYAMDITLYDSTGTTRISDTTGLTVDITIPIPDALVAFGGNNMAGAVVNGNQLEELNESFTTINGVPCIRFTATHFSPYTVYVDTGNLTEGMLDITPKTGDPIHPKWFLSIGLACLSIILFMKKDKKVKVKTA